MGVLRKVLFAVLAVVVLLVVIAGAAYAFDYQAGATVQSKRCDKGEVVVKLDIFGITHTVSEIPLQQCGVMQKGNYVEYNLRSEHARIFESKGGRCLYDTLTGPGCLV